MEHKELLPTKRGTDPTKLNLLCENALHLDVKSRCLSGFSSAKGSEAHRDLEVFLYVSLVLYFNCGYSL